MKILSDKWTDITNLESVQCFSNNSESTKEILSKITNRIIKIIKNYENDIKNLNNKRCETELFFYEDDNIDIEIISEELAKKIKDHFDDIENNLRDIPISEICVLYTINPDNCKNKFFFKFR